MAITRISYLGDVRFKLRGENPRKVTNIVEGNIENFKRLYQPIIREDRAMRDNLRADALPNSLYSISLGKSEIS